MLIDLNEMIRDMLIEVVDELMVTDKILGYRNLNEEDISLEYFQSVLPFYTFMNGVFITIEDFDGFECTEYSLIITTELKITGFNYSDIIRFILLKEQIKEELLNNISSNKLKGYEHLELSYDFN